MLTDQIALHHRSYFEIFRPMSSDDVQTAEIVGRAHAQRLTRSPAALVGAAAETAAVPAVGDADRHW